jgi:hypothetical protein
MGIININYINEEWPKPTSLQIQAQAALEEKLMLDHRKGKHPYGSMRRECPLCQAAK